ncbi:MAG TPA: neutral/alkaline non-lysosomal ceramidase N-terminal domain-containing protein [Dehalococcoidia bacterium]|nr:neutral/alkaline non-lysosomal ceramidase N-terminal domain-containing protein [Dehalococcoidia bacterium]
MPKPLFLAGAAAVPISPLPQHLEGRLYLGGYDGYLGRPASGVHDPLFARALVLSHGGTTLALVALDLVGMANSHIARIRRPAARRLGLPERSVLVACTHSHASPDLQGLWGGVSPDYAAHIRRRAVNALVQAADGLREVTLRAATVPAKGRSINRRGWPETDEALTVLQVRDRHKNAVATLVNFAAHPTVTQAENRLISRDFPGALVDRLEAELGGLALFVNADQGDANPNVSGDFGVAQSYGDELAGDAVRALKKAQDISPPLQVLSRDVDIPLANPRLRLPPPLVLQGFLAAVRGLAGPGALRWLAGRYAQQDRAFVFAGMGLLAEHPVSVRDGRLVLRTRASRLRVGGELAGLAAPGEVLTHLGTALRARLNAPATLFLGLTNDTLGYFIPPDEWMTGRNGNYEESVSLGPLAAPTLERAVEDLLGR